MDLCSFVGFICRLGFHMLVFDSNLPHLPLSADFVLSLVKINVLNCTSSVFLLCVWVHFHVVLDIEMYCHLIYKTQLNHTLQVKIWVWVLNSEWIIPTVLGWTLTVMLKNAMQILKLCNHVWRFLIQSIVSSQGAGRQTVKSSIKVALLWGLFFKVFRDVRWYFRKKIFVLSFDSDWKSLVVITALDCMSI